jgi:hypothetical protein
VEFNAPLIKNKSHIKISEFKIKIEQKFWVHALLMLASCTPVHRGLQKTNKTTTKKA